MRYPPTVYVRATPLADGDGHNFEASPDLNDVFSLDDGPARVGVYTLTEIVKATKTVQVVKPRAARKVVKKRVRKPKTLGRHIDKDVKTVLARKARHAAAMRKARRAAKKKAMAGIEGVLAVKRPRRRVKKAGG